MALQYTHPDGSADPSEILGSYIQWYSCVQQVLTYQKSQKIPLGIVAPSNFAEWANAALDQAQDLIPLHQDMVTKADALIKHAIDSGAAPDFAAFEAFTKSYTNFCASLSSTLEKFHASTQGIDPVTGLKQGTLLHADFDRELDRLSRKDNPFVLALVKINKFSTISLSARIAMTQKAAETIKKNLRSYDDAYYIGEGSFAVLLRQATKSEGVTVMSRSTKQFEFEDVVTALGDKNICLLSCVAEPLPGDQAEIILSSLQEQASLYQVEGGTVIEHIEISPFEKFIQSKQS